MKWRHPFGPQLEQLEDRIVAHAVFMMPARLTLPGNPLFSALAVSLQQQQDQQTPVFRGVIRGTWSASQLNPDVGITQTLNGLGTVAPLGVVQANTSLHAPGFIVQGFTTRTMVLTNAQGSLTLSLVGQQPQPGVSPPSSALDCTITGGTGAYAGASLRESSRGLSLKGRTHATRSVGQFHVFPGDVSLSPVATTCSTSRTR